MQNNFECMNIYIYIYIFLLIYISPNKRSEEGFLLVVYRIAPLYHFHLIFYFIFDLICYFIIPLEDTGGPFEATAASSSAQISAQDTESSILTTPPGPLKLRLFPQHMLRVSFLLAAIVVIVIDGFPFFCPLGKTATIVFVFVF